MSGPTRQNRRQPFSSISSNREIFNKIIKFHSIGIIVFALLGLDAQHSSSNGGELDLDRSSSDLNI